MLVCLFVAIVVIVVVAVVMSFFGGVSFLMVPSSVLRLALRDISCHVFSVCRAVPTLYRVSCFVDRVCSVS